MIRNTAKHTLFLIFSMFLLSHISFALPEDREKLIELAADFADLNQKNYRGEYVGHVQIDQGSTHLHAAHAITKTDPHHKLVVAIVRGSKTEQAHFWTQTAEDKPLLHAYADTIYYYPNRHLIELIGHTRVIQGEHSISAPKLSYNTIKQQIISKPIGPSRTVIIIHPSRKPA